MTTVADFRPLLCIEHLKTSINTGRGIVRAVDGIFLSVDRGRSLAIVGESGCGKSMLCRTIVRLLPKNAEIAKDSRIWFNGTDLSSVSEKKINTIRGRHISMVFQDPMSSLNPVLKVGTQITETLIYHLKMTPKAATHRAVDLLKTLGVADPQRRFFHCPHQLSGGLRQRAAIAIALCCEPDLLIADEPTTALDVTVQAEILNLLSQQQIQRNMAMILVTHDLGIAAGRTHDIAVMYAGKIVEQAPATLLFSNACMPYTRALIGAIPRLNQPSHTRLKSISGQPPDLMESAPGCRFAPRCAVAGKKCHKAEPPLKSINGGIHRYACWYPIGVSHEP